MGYFLLITFVQVLASMHAVNRGFHYHFVALILIAPIVGAAIYFWLYYSPLILPYLKMKMRSLSAKKKFLLL